MKYTFTPTLERRALIKVITLMWHENEIHQRWYNVRNSPWQDLRKQISENVEKLEIPPIFKKQLRGLIVPIGEEIFGWWQYHGWLTNSHSLKMPLEFSWTPQGTIDERKTAEDLVKNEDIDINDRYFWACFYSMELEIPTLWGKIDKSDGHKLATDLSSDAVVSYWTFRMDENLEWLPTGLLSEFGPKFRECSSNLFVLNDICGRDKNAAKIGLDVCSLFENGIIQMYFSGQIRFIGPKYFFDKLTPEERLRFSSEFKVRPEYQTADQLYFIFSLLDENNQNRVLCESCDYVLISFLFWPRHEFFLDVAARSWDYLKCSSFRRLLELIMKPAQKDIDGYAKLFQDFWMQSPGNMKEYVVRHFDDYYLSELCLLDRRLALLVFNYAVGGEINLFGFRSLTLCRYLLLNKEWDLFKAFILEHLISLESVTKFKNFLVENFLEYPNLMISSMSDPSCTSREQDGLQRAQLILDSVLKEWKTNEEKKNIDIKQSSSKRRCIEQ